MPARTLALGLAAIVVASLASGESLAQRYYYGQPVYHSAVVHSSVVATPAPCSKPTGGAPSASDLLKNCHCDNHPDECNCECKKCLDCIITLPLNCCASDCTTTPIKCDILGKVPRIDRDTDCYVRTIKFQGLTKVPQIVCETKTCVEIDKKKVECLEDCEFEVCVPVNKCCEQTVRCELTNKLMNIEAKLRDNGTWDIYVVNANPGSPQHAGGMPRVWVLYHCLSLNKLQSTFPGQSFAKAERAEAKDTSVAAAGEGPSAEKALVTKG
ncbi:hypothetical protein MalM25_35070 [Planctomycetes bacterium MalM25]|nr:hypothetical protein MalM25_35070 [Planctomycetes bacterium MalM25]